jgi:hypothetical protein
MENLDANTLLKWLVPSLMVLLLIKRLIENQAKDSEESNSEPIKKDFITQLSTVNTPRSTHLANLMLVLLFVGLPALYFFRDNELLTLIILGFFIVLMLFYALKNVIKKIWGLFFTKNPTNQTTHN